MSLLTYIFILLIIIYLGSLLSYILGNLINNKKNNISHHLHPVSVIVAVKDGESSLNNLLKDLKSQTYEGQMEFIIVDDQSCDKTKEIIKELAKKDLRFIYETSINGNENLFFKKRALDAGINRSKSDILLFTDVDCRLKPKWIESMASQFINDIDYVIGVSEISSPTNIVSTFQKIDLLMMMTAGRAKTMLNEPIACTGQNQGYKKHLYFDNGGFLKINDSIQGDDSLFMNLCKKNGAQITFNDEKNSFVESRKESLFNSFIKQRIRWAADAKVMWKYNKKFFINLLSTFIANLIVISFPIIFLFSEEQNLKLIYIFILFKFFLELIVYSLGTIKLKTNFNLIHFVMWFIINSPYVVLAGFGSFFSRFIVWKGQTKIIK